MANDLTWIEMRNHVVEDFSSTTALYKNIILDLKRFLTGYTGYETNGTLGVWSVINSCDGAGNVSASDLWTDVSKIVRNTQGNNHSWIQLRNTTLGLDCVIDVAGGDNPYPMQLIFAPASGFNTAGTALVRPQGTYEWGHDASSSYRWIHNNTATAMKVHGLLSTRGDFWFFTSHDTTGAIYSAMGACKVLDPVTGDGYPWATYFRGNNVPFTRATMVPCEPGGEGPLQGSFAGRAWAGALQAPFNCCWPIMGDTNAYGRMFSPLDGVGPAGADSTTLLFPIYIGIGGSTGNSDFKGRWPDTYLGFTTVPTNTASPTTTAQERLKINACWFPFASGRFLL